MGRQSTVTSGLNPHRLMQEGKHKRMRACTHIHPSITVKPRITLCLGVYIARAHVVSGARDGQTDICKSCRSLSKEKIRTTSLRESGIKAVFQ